MWVNYLIIHSCPWISGETSALIHIHTQLRSLFYIESLTWLTSYADPNVLLRIRLKKAEDDWKFNNFMYAQYRFMACIKNFKRWIGIDNYFYLSTFSFLARIFWCCLPHQCSGFSIYFIWHNLKSKPMCFRKNQATCLSIFQNGRLMGWADYLKPRHLDGSVPSSFPLPWTTKKAVSAQLSLLLNGFSSTPSS